MMLVVKNKYCLMVLTIILFSTVMISSIQAGQRNPLEFLTLTMEFKENNSFYSQEQQFFINKKTVIIDIDSKRTDFDSLVFPCSAKVRYRVSKNNKPICEKIVIKRHLR